MENLFVVYIVGALVYVLFCCIVSLCAGYETNAEHQRSATRMAARMWLTIPVWPLTVVYGLLVGVCRLWVAAQWGK